MIALSEEGYKRIIELSSMSYLENDALSAPHCDVDELYKINKGVTKIILKKILSKYLPEKLFIRPKAGFAIPISDWMRNDLKDWVNDILSFEICNKHNFFNFTKIQKLKDEHFKGMSNHEHKLWSIIQFNNWYLTHMD